MPKACPYILTFRIKNNGLWIIIALFWYTSDGNFAERIEMYD